MREQLNWYRLDNQANIYPAVSNNRNTNVFRLSCILKKQVQPALLQQALETTMPDFPYYSVIMRRGLFWFYFEESGLKPEVVYEQHRPCRQIFHIENKDLLFQVSYFGNRVNLEVFHALADGGGAMEFLRTLIYNYLLQAEKEAFPFPPVLDRAVPPITQAEDGFQKHYTTRGKKQSPVKQRAYSIEGTMLPLNDVQVISGEVSTKKILDLTKSKKTTLTTYLTALMIKGIQTEIMSKRQLEKDVSITIPVDLRGVFPSKTFRNFFSVVDVRYNFETQSPSFEDILISVQEQLVEKTTPEYLAQTLNYHMSVQENLLARAVPLVIKNQVLKVVYKRDEKNNTTTLSNLGRITMPSEMVPYIHGFSTLINPTSFHQVKLCITSFEDVMMINFTSRIAETGIQRYLFRHLAQQGVPVTLTTNGGDPRETL